MTWDIGPVNCGWRLLPAPTRLENAPCGKKKAFTCPYHAWTYGLDGALIGAPHMDEVPHFRREDYPLNRIAADVWDGHVFLNLDVSPQPLASQLADLVPWFGWPGQHATEIETAIDQQILLALRGSTTPQAALDEAASPARRILGS